MPVVFLSGRAAKPRHENTHTLSHLRSLAFAEQPRSPSSALVVDWCLAGLPLEMKKKQSTNWCEAGKKKTPKANKPLALSLGPAVSCRGAKPARLRWRDKKKVSRKKIDQAVTSVRVQDLLLLLLAHKLRRGPPVGAEKRKRKGQEGQLILIKSLGIITASGHHAHTQTDAAWCFGTSHGGGGSDGSPGGGGDGPK